VREGKRKRSKEGMDKQKEREGETSLLYNRGKKEHIHFFTLD